MAMSVLNRPTLVLNKNWVPINTISVRDAIVRCSNEWLDDRNKIQPVARILDIDTWRLYSWDDWKELLPIDGDAIVHSAHGQHKAPEIIIVGRYSRIPKNQLNFNRKNVFRRDGDTCQYCGKRFPNSELSFDHVIPKCQGGGNSWDNIVLSCVGCNQKKGGRTPEEAGMKLIRQPMKPGLEILGANHHRIRSWEIFFGREAPNSRDAIVSEAYWEVPLIE